MLLGLADILESASAMVLLKTCSYSGLFYIRFGDMDAQFPYDFIGSGAMDYDFPFKFIHSVRGHVLICLLCFSCLCRPLGVMWRIFLFELSHVQFN